MKGKKVEDIEFEHRKVVGGMKRGQSNLQDNMSGR
jgi:hypothetical protein